MTADQQRLQTILRQVRRRFKSIASIRGLALWLGFSLLAVAAAVTAVDYWNYGQRVLVVARWTSLLVIGLSLAWLVVRPLARRISDIRIARTIEERYPQLQDRLVTATELISPAGRNSRRHPFLPLLLRDAARQSRVVNPGEIFNRREPLQSVLASSGLVLLFILLQLLGPSYFQYATLKLYADGWWPQAAPLYRIEVSPGDIRIRKGSDQTVTASLEGFEAAMKEGTAVGRRLVFLSQEILRELNTVGSKCRDLEMQRGVVEGKVLCEQLREQAQNVE